MAAIRVGAQGLAFAPGNETSPDRADVVGDMDDRAALPRWIGVTIYVGAGLFVLALVVSAIFDPRIRLLHTLQALIYVAVIVLARRSSPWGLGAGFVVALFWNYINLFVTNFIAAGLSHLGSLLTTGRLTRPDLLVAVVAGAGHFALMVGCLAGFLRRRPGALAWGKFLAGGVLAIAYFVAIIVTTGPQYIPLLRRVFRIDG
jgi:hypothetical protein